MNWLALKDFGKGAFFCTCFFNDSHNSLGIIFILPRQNALQFTAGMIGLRLRVKSQQDGEVNFSATCLAVAFKRRQVSLKTPCCLQRGGLFILVLFGFVLLKLKIIYSICQFAQVFAMYPKVLSIGLSPAARLFLQLI